MKKYHTLSVEKNTPRGVEKKNAVKNGKDNAAPSNTRKKRQCTIIS